MLACDGTEEESIICSKSYRFKKEEKTLQKFELSTTRIVLHSRAFLLRNGINKWIQIAIQIYILKKDGKNVFQVHLESSDYQLHGRHCCHRSQFSPNIREFSTKFFAICTLNVFFFWILHPLHFDILHRKFLLFMNYLEKTTELNNEKIQENKTPASIFISFHFSLLLSRNEQKMNLKLLNIAIEPLRITTETR